MDAIVDIECLAKQVESHGDYQVIRKLIPHDKFYDLENKNLLKGIILDVETTGRDIEKDKIIEICLLAFHYEPHSGKVSHISSIFNGLEDPNMPIPKEATAINGITNEMVLGKKINDKMLEDFVQNTRIIIAHNANFDRPFIEKRFSFFERFDWGCSHIQINWHEEGISSSKLEYIAYKNLFFYDAHRAEIDCRALLEVLQKPLFNSQELPLKVILEKKDKEDYILYANNAHYDFKDILKNSRGYQWRNDKRFWHKLFQTREGILEECKWLKENIYDNKSIQLDVECLDSKVRFSRRRGTIKKIQL